VLAVVFSEAGADRVVPFIGAAAISAVNLAEVVAKLCERGAPDDEIERELNRLALTVVPFDEVLGFEAGNLHRATRGKSISLGDRACLVTARRLGVPAVTGDRAWAELDFDVAVELIR
jgi:PIN domain nuclease of toxin-antitoxin system